MKWVKGLQPNSWWFVNLWISGLMIAIALAGMVALGINAQVKHVLHDALQHDLEIEDRTDDLKMAVLDMRHFHRNLIFGGPSPRRLNDFEAAYEQLLIHIDDLDRLGITEPNLLQPDELREKAQQYYAGFQPSIALYESDPQAFDLASDDGLWLLAELESEVHRIERFGERHAAGAVQEVDSAINSAQLLLIAKLVGHILIGAALAFLIVRNLREQRQTAVELARSLQLKTEFIADVSHELRTPLTVLRANAEVALDLASNCDHKDLLHEILQESERMTQLVEDLLFLARSDAGAMPFELEIANIEIFLDQLAERANLLIGQYGSELKLNLTAEGPVQIDRIRLAQAILNLVDNAGKYSPAGGTITLRSVQTDTEIIIEVADNGPGIPEQELPLIFERFYRVQKVRSRKTGGVGLGLAIAKSIVIAHGGRIEVVSTVGKGTTMRCCLPSVAITRTAIFSPAPLTIEKTV